MQAFNIIAKQFEFKDAHLELMSDGRQADLLTFIKEHFHPDEPIMRSIGYTPDEEYDQLITLFHKDNLSLVLVSDKTNEIIACRTMGLAHRDEPLDPSELENEKLVTLFKFFTHKHEEMNVYKRFNIETSLDFFVLGTHRDHRKQGIASKIFQAAMLFAKELGLKQTCIHGDATGVFSQKIFEKFGFETLHTFKYDEYKVDGEIVFKDTGIHKSTKVFVKKL